MTPFEIQMRPGKPGLAVRWRPEQHAFIARWVADLGTAQRLLALDLPRPSAVLWTPDQAGDIDDYLIYEPGSHIVSFVEGERFDRHYAGVQ